MLLPKKFCIYWSVLLAYLKGAIILLNKLKVGIIGAGQIAYNSHIPHYKGIDEVEVLGICDLNFEHAKIIAKKHEIEHVFKSMEEMFDALSLDAVSVCVPNKFHKECVIFALNHGCNVLCEKPPAISCLQAKEMEDCAADNKKILAYNFHLRHGKEFQYLKRQIDNGVFGNIYSTNVEYIRRRGIPGWGNFIDKNIQGGGPLIDLGVHVIDLVLYMLDYPQINYVCATTHAEIGTRKGVGLMGDWDPEKFTVEDAAFGFISLKNGASIKIATSFALNCKQNRNTVEIYGSNAGASLFPLEIFSEEDGVLYDKPIIIDTSDDRHKNSIINFVNSCLGKEDIIVKAHQGTIMQNIVEKLYLSSQTNKPIFF